MKKVIVFQHVAHKILGTLNPTLKTNKLNIRYINFERTPNERPSLQKYDALIVLGGHMGVFESDRYQHIKVEMQLIEEALKKEIPILGICLGAQLIASVLGAEVKKHTVKEIGWYDIDFNHHCKTDPLFQNFDIKEKLFQLHGDTFSIPHGATQLASSATCNSQAFRYGSNVYATQFHLEVDEAMILRWLSYEAHEQFCAETIKQQTQLNLQRSIDLSLKTFESFVKLFHTRKNIIQLGSDHSKPL